MKRSSVCIIAALFASLVTVFFPQPADAEGPKSFDDVKGSQTEAPKVGAKGHKSYLKEKDLGGTEFSTEFTAGLLNLTGNTRSLSVSGGNHTLYRYKRFENNWRVGGYYSRVFSVRSQAGLTGTVARYIYGSYRMDYYISDRLSYFAGGGGYTDRFNGIELSGIGSTGFRYFFLKEPEYYLSGAAGYRYAYEDRVAPNPGASYHTALAELNYWQQLNDRVSITNDMSLLENVLDGNDFRAGNKTALKVNMTDRLALVLGFELKFRNRPVPGFKKLDTITEFLLSATF
ncbi:MAG TPA: DUF481 domain-containing protein [bacterium]|nr:DUF481 domain-containing protein [bacterium]